MHGCVVFERNGTWRLTKSGAWTQSFPELLAFDLYVDLHRLYFQVIAPNALVPLEYRKSREAGDALGLGKGWTGSKKLHFFKYKMSNKLLWHVKFTHINILMYIYSYSSERIFLGYFALVMLNSYQWKVWVIRGEEHNIYNIRICVYAQAYVSIQDFHNRSQKKQKRELCAKGMNSI